LYRNYTLHATVDLARDRREEWFVTEGVAVCC